MDNNKYIEVVKKVIAGKALDYSTENILSPVYFDDLFTQIKDNIIVVCNMFQYPEVDEVTLKNYYDIAVKEYLSNNPIDIDPSNSLTKEGFKTWLTSDRKENIKWNYSKRYFTLLENSGRSEKVVTETINSSYEILEKMGDPKSDTPFYVKGLVVGSVQSGKTGNFNAVINRAIDSGYRLVIVLSGIMEDLRSQTQLRIESDVIGNGIIDLTSETKGVKGVGKITRFGNLGDNTVNQVVSITSYKSDFNKSLVDADFSIDNTNVLVCKKNVSVLRNLIVWLHDYLEENKDRHNIPLLILDDEADNASLNNEGAKGREYASKTNGHIRALLDLFTRKTYLGYTATPFANVLQDRNEVPEDKWKVSYKLKGEDEEKHLTQVDNIFPDDFIVLLNPPSNYIGAKQIFETFEPIDNKIGIKIPLIEIVSDTNSEFPSRIDKETLLGVQSFRTKDEFDDNGGYLNYESYKDYISSTRATKTGDNFPKNLPKSLIDSVMCFVLSIAIRESRKQKMIYSASFMPHHTMLIHISRFSLWQNTTRDLLIEYVTDLQSKIENETLTSTESIYSVLEKVWYKYYSHIIESIESYLPKGYHDEFLIPITFESLKSYLPDAINNIEVKAINSVTKDSLEYPKSSPKKIIAVGGNRLSRGFTLEGLTINYFIRSTDYSDTLLQMGRWFGYRPGYLDCCKLFTTQDSKDKFDSTTRTIEELEVEFRKMEAKNKTPQNFVLRVRKHPGTLKITRPSILRMTNEVKWSYQDELEQTTVFNLNKDKINNVWNEFKNNIAPKFHESSDSGFIKYKTDIHGIINILSSENNFDEDSKKSMIMFLELCREKNKLKDWTVALKTSGRSTKLQGLNLNEPFGVNLSVRSGPTNNSDIDYLVTTKKFKASGKSANIISGGKDFSILLSPLQIAQAEAEFHTEHKNLILKKNPTLSDEEAMTLARQKTKPERVYRERMSDQEGLLVIYLFNTEEVFHINDDKAKALKQLAYDDSYDLKIPLVGYALGFPPIEPDPGGIYVKGDYKIEDEEYEKFEDEEYQIEESDSIIPSDNNE
ncbi:Z1 domain-containing protein [Flavobacterium sp. KJJ]|uniref:Z1 domain-containing protein n=1 Tax=Flavobacterium sp. KJJ TaxID=1270193 RepID=UPI0004930B24|nr:Z1 domain-containing protein [Flavobacterium sp. KJJ]